MFYQNTGVKSYRNCEGPEGHSDESELTGWCRTKSFRISLLSSNNPDDFKTRIGFVVCENHSGYHLMPAYVSFQVNYTVPSYLWHPRHVFISRKTRVWENRPRWWKRHESDWNFATKRLNLSPPPWHHVMLFMNTFRLQYSSPTSI